MAQGRNRQPVKRRSGKRSSAASGAAAAPDRSEANRSEADRVIDAAMAMIGERGWRSVSLAAVAHEAGLTALQVYRIFPAPASILCGFLRRIDEAVLAVPAEAEPGERPRDRVFDVLMRRFDALRPHRNALVRLRRELPFDPPSALAAGAALLCSMRWMLDGAGISTRGIRGIVAVKLTAAAYIAAAHTWAADESPDLAPTMAVLDRRLRAIEGWMTSVSRDTRSPEAA